MKKTLWNEDIRNGIIGGLYFQLIWIALTFIYSLVESKSKDIPLSDSIKNILLWFSNNLVLSFGIIISLTIISVILYVNFRNRNPIKWNFKGFLGMGGRGNNGLIDWEIKLFQAEGKNRSGKTIINLYGYIEIERTKERLPIKLNKNGKVVNIEEMVALPKGEILKIVAGFDKNIENYAAIEGYDAQTFLSHYTPFTLVIIVEGKEFRHLFTKDDSKTYIDAIVENKFASPEKTVKVKGPIFK